MTEINAQIRGVIPGTKQPTAADDAHRLMSDPALQKAFAELRMSIVGQIERLVIDGEPTTTAIEAELCRTLRVVSGVKRALGLALQGQILRDHDFRATALPNAEEKI